MMERERDRGGENREIVKKVMMGREREKEGDTAK